MSNKTATPLGTVKLREGDFREVMDPLLDIFEYHKVLVPDAAGIYSFDAVKLGACPPTAYKQIISKNFRAPGGDLIGFSNLVAGGAAGEKLGSPFRTMAAIPIIKGSGGKLTSEHAGRGRTPKRSPGKKDELLTRAHMLCLLARGKTRADAIQNICNFEVYSANRSRVLTQRTGTATQSNSLDATIKSARKEVSKLTSSCFPECALTKMINIIALGREHEITLYENKQTSTPSPVSLIDFIGRTDGEDRREYSRLTGGGEWPFLTKDDIDKILLHYSRRFPDTVNQHVTAQLRAALGA